MSTRCQIGVCETEAKLLKPAVLLYRHSDGYPGDLDTGDYGVLVDLVPILRMFAERRGLSDIEYLGAWLIHGLIELHIERSKGYARQFNFVCADGKDCLGYGISADFHGDIEYYYAIIPGQGEPGGELRVYENRSRTGAPESIEELGLVKTIKI